MSLGNRNFSDFFRIEGNNVFQTAEEFYKFTELTKSQKEYFYRRISYNGSDPVMEILDQDTNTIQKMISFAGNGYLNLAKHPKTIAAGIEALKKCAAKRKKDRSIKG